VVESESLGRIAHCCVEPPSRPRAKYRKHGYVTLRERIAASGLRQEAWVLGSRTSGDRS